MARLHRATAVAALIASLLTSAPPARAWTGPTDMELHTLPWDGPRWRALRACESPSGADSTSRAFHGWYQFTLSSWRGAGGWGDPHAWTLEEQTQRARWWWAHTAPSGQWPWCYRHTNARNLADRD